MRPRLPHVHELPQMRVRVRSRRLKERLPRLFKAKLAELPVPLKPAAMERVPEVAEELRRSLKPSDELLAVYTGLPPEGAADYALGPAGALELKLLRPVESKVLSAWRSPAAP